jgi:hypothetical protein
MPDFEQHPVKALVEGIISLFLLVEGFSFPLYSIFVYQNAVNGRAGKAACPSASGALEACTEEGLKNLLFASRITLASILVVGLFYFGASILLGALSRKYALGAGKVGKAKVGYILGTVGFVSSIATLAVLLTLGILFLTKLA